MSYFVEEFTGRTWRMLSLPTVRGGTQTTLNDVSCARTVCMIVGAYDTKSSAHPLAMTLRSGMLRILTAGAPRWARTPELAGVSCVSSAFCMTTGDDIVTGRVFSEVWNGVRWRPVAVPGPAGASSLALGRVSCPDAGDCVAIGWQAVPTSQGSAPLSEVFARGRWHLAAEPAGTASAALSGVSCASARRCVAVGQVGSKALIQTWNGHRWFASTGPGTGPGTTENELADVSCASTTRCVAVGARSRPGVFGTFQTLAEIRMGGRWVVMRTVNP